MDGSSKLKKWVTISRDINEIIKPHRPIPRIMVGLYGYLLFEVVMWGMGIPGGLSGSQAALVSAIVGAGSVFFGFYVNSKDGSE